MPKINSNRACGIQVEDYSWGRWVKGTRAMLIHHGFAQDELFPGDPGAGKRVHHTTDPNGRAIDIQRASKYLFVVRREWNDEEADAFYEAEKIREEKKAEIAAAKSLIDAWPKSASSYREQVRESLDWAFRILEIYILSGARGGYRFDDIAAGRFNAITDQLRELIDTGNVLKDKALREQHVPECIAKSWSAIEAAKQDKGFQQFMGMVAK